MTKNETTKAKISVIVPAHNVEGYLDKCLEMLVRQTLRDIEIICVNDHSEDETPKILAEWKKKDARIKVFECEERGLSAARNCGLDHACGEFIMFCDSDDWFDLTACEKMLKAIEESGADMAICEINYVYHAHKERRLWDEDYGTLRYSGVQKVTKLMMQNINVYAWNKIYRKSIIDKYNLRFPVGRSYEDAYFTFSYLCVSKKVYFLRERLYYYIRREGSIMAMAWSKKNAKDASPDHVHVIIAWHAFLKKTGLFEKFAPLFWGIFRDYAHLAMQSGKTKKTRRYTQGLVYDFVRQNCEDFAVVDRGVKDGIIGLVPKLKYRNLSSIKRSLLRFFPTLRTQIHNVERLEMLARRNARLLYELADLVGEKK